MNTKVMFSSADSTWETPQDFFDRLDQEFHFHLDVCATPETAKCAAYFTPEINGLTQDWSGTCWCNPPYGREISQWVQKACQESRDRHAVVVMLLPARTDTSWWHEYVMQAAEVRFVRGRLKFGGSPNSAPFPSAVVVFDQSVHDQRFCSYPSPMKDQAWIPTRKPCKTSSSGSRPCCSRSTTTTARTT